jgi:hypothetical protein
MDELLLHTGPSGVSINFPAVPVLREHITIPPHASVADANHSYSFTEAGDQVCFHSPTSLPEGQESLTSFLSRVAGDGREDGLIYADSASDVLNSLLSFLREDGPQLSLDSQDRDGDGISRWREFGWVLRTEFGIEQYALVNWE